MSSHTRFSIFPHELIEHGTVGVTMARELQWLKVQQHILQEISITINGNEFTMSWVIICILIYDIYGFKRHTFHINTLRAVQYPDMRFCSCCTSF